MFTINFKSKSGSPDVNQINIEMIIYRSGYAHVPKVTKVTGLAKYWDEKAQMQIHGRKVWQEVFFLLFNKINEQFVMDFVLYTQEQGVANGNQ